MNKNLIYYLACTKEQSGWFSKAVGTARRLVQQSGRFRQQLLIKRLNCFSNAAAAASCDSLTHRKNPVQLSLTDWLTKWPCCSVRSVAQLLQRAASGTVRDSGCSSRSDNSCLNDRFIFRWSSVWSLVIQISPLWIRTSIDFTYIHNLFLLKCILLFNVPHRALCCGLRLFISVLTLVKVRLCEPSGIAINIITTITIVLCFPHRIPSSLYYSKRII
jgi:hypothetical protein